MGNNHALISSPIDVVNIIQYLVHLFRNYFFAICKGKYADKLNDEFIAKMTTYLLLMR